MTDLNAWFPVVTLVVLSTQFVVVSALWWRGRRATQDDLYDRLSAQQADLYRELRLDLAHVEERLRDAAVESRESVDKGLLAMADRERQTWDALRRAFQDQWRGGQEQLELIRRLIDEKFQSFSADCERQRSTLEAGLKRIAQDLSAHSVQSLQTQRAQAELIATKLHEQTASVGAHLSSVQQVIHQRLQEMHAGNEKKLEEMRQTVNEKLQSTLEQRIGESFKQVVVNLESVQRGLGEMQNLAKGVGDLNRVFSNVKTRGVFGEVQLRAILDEMLYPDQFVVNFQPNPDSSDAVEFAIKIPNSNGGAESCTYIPIDAKFPKEDYERLRLASEEGDLAGVDAARKRLLIRIEDCAADICHKYVVPPVTTSFGIMFLATEGLYAEALREPGFQERLQREYRVIIAGPTTLSAIITSLSVGFQTVAIERRSNEIRMILGAVKTEFGKFGQVLEKVKKQLGSASRSIDQTFVRTRKMEGALDSIDSMPAAQTTQVFELLDCGLDEAFGAEAQDDNEGDPELSFGSGS